MNVPIIVPLVLLLVLGAGLGASLYHDIAGSRSDRERALEAQIDALKRANYLGAEFFNASQELREEMARSAQERDRRARSRGRARAWVYQADASQADVIDGDWRD